MQKKTEEHVFQGMQRDTAISKQKAEFLWDAHNIRLTSRHGDTLFSMTNERGTRQINNISLRGVVLGYCVLGNYLTVFTTVLPSDLQENEKPDYIYRIEKIGGNFDQRVLYNGHLGFEPTSPIECLGVYENVDIQKVYWTDGVNQPRFINITRELVDGTYIDTSFDFIPTLSLNDEIHVKKVADSSGLFPAGVIQYAVTYYNKYGQESNISVVSPLIATSYTQRAGSPEETIGNAFKITIKNPDTNFEFLRLYSIFRSSKDTTPVCKRVADVKITKNVKVLQVSDDAYETRYRRTVLDSVYYQEKPDTPFKKLTNNTSNIGTTPADISGVLFEASRYWRFSKRDFPQLVIRANVVDGQTVSQVYMTWDSCTDLYISMDKILGPDSNDNQLIFCDGGKLSMKVASDMSYVDTESPNGSDIMVTDNNTIGEDIDYNQLLFVGGEEITAGTLTQKDGTMFLGNIEIRRPQITGKYNVTKDQQTGKVVVNGTELLGTIVNNVSVHTSHRECWFPITMNSDTYHWGNTLDAKIYNDGKTEDSTNIAGFKYWEHYRLGLQFQYKTGKWSQPVFIGDETNNTVKPSINIDTSLGYCKQNVPIFRVTLSASAGAALLAKDYLRVRSVVCFPTESDQLAFCQGAINPTVHSITGRLNHTPDIQSSWYFRPVPEKEYNTIQQNGGDAVQYKDGYTLYSDSNSRKDEIQGMPHVLSNIPISDILNPDTYKLKTDEHDQVVPVEINLNDGTPGTPEDDKLKTTISDSADLTNTFVVDWNYLTFHSPEFEFNDSFYNLDTTTLKCRIIGRHLLVANQGDVHIMTSSAPISTEGPGFYHRVVSSYVSAARINAGLFYRDSIVQYQDLGSDKEFTPSETVYPFLVYPWHRTGSVNNDVARPPEKGSRTSVLNLKKLINIMYFGEPYRIKINNGKQEDINFDLADADIKVFNSDQVSMVKIDGKNYFGNIDQVISPCFKYPIVLSESNNFTSALSRISRVYPTNSEKKAGLLFSNEPVYMKYKSTPHAVIHSTIVPQSSNTDYNLNIGYHRTGVPNDSAWPYLYCAEIYREPQDSDFGGISPMAIHNNLWVPAGPAVKINPKEPTEIEYMYGDTYYQRYDCLKTYPFTDEDTNSIIEIGSFMVETRINLDGRYDKSRGDISNFMLNPTVFNLINPVYSQKDNFFNYRILDDDFYALSKYPTMVTWTGYKNNAAEVDSWTNITLASTLEMDGTKGKVNAVRVNSDQLYCFQDDAVGQILFNSRVQISPSDGVPIEISNNYKVDGNRYISTSIGCKNKWSIIEGLDGLYFIDSNTEALYLLGGQSQLKSISTPLNMSYWFMTQDCSTEWLQRYRENGYTWKQRGIRCFYDSANADLYICTPETTLCFSEKLGQFVSFFDYHNVIGMFNIDSEYYALNYPDNNDTSLPVTLWGMFQGQYNTFFDKTYQTDFTFISNENPLNDKIFSNLELRGDFRYWPKNSPQPDFNSTDHMVDHRKMFDTVRVWNEYQDTGDIDLRFIDDTHSNMKKKFRIWRMDIPRDKDNIRQRIRNTWCKVKFTMNTLPEISLQELCGKVSTDFMVFIDGQWKDLDFRGMNTRFVYDADNDRIVEKTLEGIEQDVAYYTLSGNMLVRTGASALPMPIVYAYRKIYDMEIHDTGVVYYA